MKFSIKNYYTLTFSGFLLIFIVIGSFIFIQSNGGGYFSKYCLDPGIYNFKHDAERHLGKYPCKSTNDSIHEIKFFWSDPRPKGKFIK